MQDRTVWILGVLAILYLVLNMNGCLPRWMTVQVGF